MNDETIEKLAIEMTNKYFDIMPEDEKKYLYQNPEVFSTRYLRVRIDILNHLKSQFEIQNEPEEYFR